MIFPSVVFFSDKNSTIVRKLVDLILMPFMLSKTLSYFPCIVLSLAAASCHALSYTWTVNILGGKIKRVNILGGRLSSLVLVHIAKSDPILGGW